MNDDLWQQERDLWGEEPDYEPHWSELNPEKVCGEDMTSYASVWAYEPPEYAQCWNAKVHGFDKCWVHLTREQKREFAAIKSQERQSIKSPC